MRILVTGGAGFIGSHLIDHLLQEGHEIISIDNFDPFYDKNIKLRNIERHFDFNTFNFMELDIRNRDAIFSIFHKYQPEVVIHLAAKAGVRPSISDPYGYVDVNINGTINILDASRDVKVSKFIFGSSSSVYGLNTNIPFSEEDPILLPASPYAATKISGEAIARSYSNCYGLPIVSLRFFTVYGPRQRPDLAIHKFTKMILNQQPIPLFGDGTTSRDYTYVEDIVNGIKAALKKEVSQYEVYNLGNDKPTKLIDLVRLIEEKTNRKAIINWLPMQTGDLPITWADLNKSRKELGYHPKIELNEGLELFIDWLKTIEAK
ncbi:GDP-mannose 4,6-dehydratase [Tepidibacillus sp. LV47]|uniref:GDP-mannose 4,6-dehydratase n=1 Tax=Tepidibacillus sp. LV47 TaxID=3398228 RepID=UPI003AABE3A2